MPIDLKPKLIEIFTKLYNIYLTKSNNFRSKSYKKLVSTLKQYPHPIYTYDDAIKIPNITQKSLAKIHEIIDTNHLKQLNSLQKEDPDINTKIQLQSILGIGSKFAEELVNMNIKSVAELREKYRMKKVKLTKMQEIGLKYYETLHEPIPHKEITEYINKLRKSVQQLDKNAVIIGAGSYLRGKEYSGDIDIILSFPSIKIHDEWLNKNRIDEVIRQMKKDKLLKEVITKGHNNMMGITEPNKRQIDLKIAGYQAIPFYLLYFGSGEEFARKIRGYAKKKGWKLNEWGITDKSGKTIMNSADNEEEIFAKLGYNFVKPQNR